MSKFKYSAGLVVVTDNNKVVLIKRNIPYCYENYLIEKNYRLTLENFERYKEEFKLYRLHKMPSHDRKDFLNYYNGVGCMEDEYDFPHGQLPKKKKKKFKILYLNRFEKDLYKTAVREFKEETGYKFIDDGTYDRRLIVRFIANDGNEYYQFYFIKTGVRLYKVSKRDQQYDTVFLDINEAKSILLTQQKLKRDGKYMLLGRTVDNRFLKSF